MAKSAFNPLKYAKILKKAAKREIASQGIDPHTRRGNRELSILVNRLAQKLFISLEEVEQVGSDLGLQIAALSHKKGKKYLDKEIVRSLALVQTRLAGEKVSPAKIPSSVHPSNVNTELASQPEVESSGIVSSVEDIIAKSTFKEDEKAKNNVKTEIDDRRATKLNGEGTREIAPDSASSSEIASPLTEETSEITPKITANDSHGAIIVDNPSENVVGVAIEVEKATSSEAVKTVVVPTADSTSEVTSKESSLKALISQDIMRSMKAKDKIRLETVRSIKKVLLEKESQLRAEGRDDLTQDEEISLLAQQAKQRRESIEQFRAGGREDLAQKETQELAIIESYLPAQLSEEELELLVDAAIAEVGATSLKDLGKVMGNVLPQIKGRAEGKMVQQLLRQKLS
jgi:uncharacterized protein YqeY